MKAKFTEWKGSRIREMDVADGATYHCGRKDCVFLAVPNRRSVCITWEGKPDNEVAAYTRGSGPVTILDWPDHCGPRPDGTVTYEDVVENAPSKTAKAVFGTRDEWDVSEIPACKFNPTERPATQPFLGYLELLED